MRKPGKHQVSETCVDQEYIQGWRATQDSVDIGVSRPQSNVAFTSGGGQFRAEASENRDHARVH